MSLLITVIMWFHIFSAVGWMGSVLVFRLVVTPLMPKFSAPTRGEVVVKLFPNFVNALAIFATSTGVFGLLHLLASSIEEPSHFSLILPPIVIGATLAAILYTVLLFVVRPSIMRMSRILSEMQGKNQQQPPAELPKLQKRVVTLANVGLVLLVVILVLMVYAGEL
jgi:uncharacterized membrane protein